MNDSIKPILIALDPACPIDSTALALIRDHGCVQVTEIYSGPNFTATEVQMSWEAWSRKVNDLNSQLLGPMVDRILGLVSEQALGAPKRKRWDQYGAYHRKQVKKWRKRLSLW